MNTRAQLPGLSATVRALVDRAEVHRLIDRYMASHDGSTASIADFGIFTPDASLDAAYADPLTGRENIVAFQGAIMAKFEQRQHASANTLVELQGDTASFRTNMVVHQVHHAPSGPRPGDRPGGVLAGGGYLEGEAVRTAHGWRLRRVRYTAVWRRGELPLGVDAKA